MRQTSTLPDAPNVLCSDRSLSNGSSDPEGTAHIFIPWRRSDAETLYWRTLKKGPPFFGQKRACLSRLSFAYSRLSRGALAPLGRREGLASRAPEGVFPPHMSPEKRFDLFCFANSARPVYVGAASSRPAQNAPCLIANLRRIRTAPSRAATRGPPRSGGVPARAQGPALHPDPACSTVYRTAIRKRRPRAPSSE